MNQKPKIAIIGAGLSALSAARILAPHCDLEIFEKARGLSGRMSTRYAGDYEFDHGAQYFTVKSPEFRSVIDAAIQAQAVSAWTGQFLYKSQQGYESDQGAPRFVGLPRMNSLPKFMAQHYGLARHIHCQMRVSRIEPQNIDAGQESSALNPRLKQAKWQLHFEGGALQRDFDAVICTAPAPQSAALLPEDFAHFRAVKMARMQACFALMIGIDNPLNLPWQSLRVKDNPVAWMAVNSSKPGRRADLGCLVVHAEAAWSDVHQDADHAWVEDTLIEAAQHLCGQKFDGAPFKALHRWLYASNANKASQISNPPALWDGQLKLGACGDWCLGGRVEGAFESGRAMAQSVLADLL